MAEVLGIISSAITVAQVAGKIGPKLLALKRLWDEVQEIPETINALMEEVAMSCPVLDQLEDEFQQCHEMVKNDTAAMKSFEYCRQAVSELEKLIEQLQHQIRSSRKGKATLTKFKVVLKKPMIEEHQQRLQRAIRMLMISQQMYLMALTRHQPAMIVSQLLLETARTQSIVEQVPVFSCSNLGSEDESDGQEVARIERKPPGNVHRGSKWLHWDRPGFFGRFAYQVCEMANDTLAGCSSQTTTYQARLQLPWWLAQKSWDFQVSKSYGGWDASIRTWYIRESDVGFDAARDGDVERLQGLLDRREVSLYDLTTSGFTLLDLAVNAGNLEVTKFLINSGLRLDHPDHLALGQGTNIQNSSVQALIYRHIWRRPEFVKFFIEDIVPNLESTPDPSEFCRIYWSHIDPEVLVEVLDTQGVSASAFRAQLPWDGLGSIKAFVFCYFEFMHRSTGRACSHISAAWRFLARWIVNGIDAEGVFRTEWALPLNYLGLWMLQYEGMSHREIIDCLSNLTREWLYDLHLANVDLEEVGVIMARAGHRRIKTKVRLWSGAVMEICSEVLTYGPQPEDWKLHFDVDCFVEEYAGQFWRLVEAPWETMPGAWVSGDENEDKRELHADAESVPDFPQVLVEFFFPGASADRNSGSEEFVRMLYERRGVVRRS